MHLNNQEKYCKLQNNTPYYAQHKKGVLRKFFHDWGPYHIETSPIICSSNQWAGFYMTRQGFKVDGCQSNLHVMLKQLLFLQVLQVLL